MKRLVGFIGTGDYTQTTYVLSTENGECRCQTEYVIAALARFFQPDEVVILATAQARAKHGDLVNEAIREAGVGGVRIVDYPLGDSPEEHWEQYRIVTEVVSGGTQPLKEIILDITHGFRSQPFFASSVLPVLRFLRPELESVRVFYGAYRSEPTTHIWELTSILDAFDWAMDLSMFLRTGYLGDIGKRTERLGNELGRAWARGGKRGSPPRLKDFAQALQTFAEDLRTLRLGSMLVGSGKQSGSAARLLRELEAVEQIDLPQLAPLQPLLRWLREHVQTLPTDRLCGPDGHRALTALAQLYLNLGRYLEAMTVVREGLVLAHIPDTCPPPGESFDTDTYRQVSRIAIRRWHADRGSADLRNDLAHGGLRPDPRPAHRIATQVEEEVGQFASWQPSGKFANISNHPSARWSEEQRSAALRLAPELYDIPFPAVPETATLSEVDKMAKKVLEELRADTRYAMVMGEFVLSSILVRELQRRGIIVLAACTRRIVTEENGKKVSVFQFAGFRPYPWLKPYEPEGDTAEADA